MWLPSGKSSTEDAEGAQQTHELGVNFERLELVLFLLKGRRIKVRDLPLQARNDLPVEDGVEIPTPEDNVPVGREPLQQFRGFFGKTAVEHGVVLGDGRRPGGGHCAPESAMCDRALPTAPGE